MADIFEKTPVSCNTGVSCIEIDKNKKKSYSIDWLQGNFRGIKYNANGMPTNESLDVINDIIHLLGFKDKDFFDYEVVPGGFFGFRYRIDITEGVKLLLYGSKNKYGEFSSMLQLTGHGCDCLLTDKDWLNLLTYLLEKEFTCGRIDLAIDDFYGEEIKFSDVFESLKNGYFTRRGAAKSPIDFHHSSFQGDITKGMTAYCYSTSSEIQLCIYDKQEEQKQKENYLADTPQWVRYEMRFKKDNAVVALKNFYTNLLRQEICGEKDLVSKYLSSSLFDLLKLRIYNSDNDVKRNWDIDPKWLAFIGSIEDVEFARYESKKPTLENTKFYFEEQWFKFLLKLQAALGKEEFEAWLKYNLDASRHKLDAVDRLEINSLRTNLGRSELKVLDFEKVYSWNIPSKQDLDLLRHWNLPEFNDLKIKDREVQNND